MAVKPVPVEQDDDVAAALEWFMSVASSAPDLRHRISSAQNFYKASCDQEGKTWPAPESLIDQNDQIASYLAQGDALVRNRWVYDLSLASRVVPFLKFLGIHVDRLNEIPGADIRARKLLNSRGKAAHPDGGLFELVTAARYAAEGLDVEFIKETRKRSADLLVSSGQFEAHVECKRLRPSDYEAKEATRARHLFNELDAYLRDKRESLIVSINFTSELRDVPDRYLAQVVETALSSPGSLERTYSWRDDYSEGTASPSNLGAAARDSQENGTQMIGPKLARLLSGYQLPERSFFLSVAATPWTADPRYVDDIEFASVVKWECSAEQSIQSRARHITSKLADIEEQLRDARYGIAHIGMDAERDITSADRRRDRNTEAVRAFKFEGTRPTEIYLHYFLPRIAEKASWMIDETVDPFGSFHKKLLDDPRILLTEESVEMESGPAWRASLPETSG